MNAVFVCFVSYFLQNDHKRNGMKWNGAELRSPSAISNKMFINGMKTERNGTAK